MDMDQRGDKVSAKRPKLDDIGLVTSDTQPADPRPIAKKPALKKKKGPVGRADYPKLTLSLPPEIVRELHIISGERKALGQRDAGLNAIVVEALLGHFHALGRPLPKNVMRSKSRG